MTVVVALEIDELHLQIGGRPEQGAVQTFAPDGADQPFDKRTRDGFGHDSPYATVLGKPNDSRQHMQQKDGQLTHREVGARSPNPPKCSRISISPCTGVLHVNADRCLRAIPMNVW